jgi:membrane-associated protein
LLGRRISLPLNLLEAFIHLDVTLKQIIDLYGAWAYLLLFLVIFCETGFVVTPFLPGDSSGALQFELVIVLLCLASIAGDSTNYLIGRLVGPKIFSKEKVRFFNKEYLQRTHNFYERHGRKTIILARFIPIIRTFAPFVAGIGRMAYWRFLTFSITGSILWIGIFVCGGYFFGNIPLVKENFITVVMAIIVISILPGVIALLRERRKRGER